MIVPTLKCRVKPKTLAELRQERDEAEEWLRAVVDDFIDHPTELSGALESLENDYLPRYRAAWMRVRRAERKAVKP